MKYKSVLNSTSDPAAEFEHGGTVAYDSAQWRTLWLRCLEAASNEWHAIPYNDLAVSGGDPRKLMRLIHMHYDLPDSEVRRQVEIFLRECQARS